MLKKDNDNNKFNNNVKCRMSNVNRTSNGLISKGKKKKREKEFIQSDLIIMPRCLFL